MVLFNVGTHGGALPGLLAIEQSVTAMVADGTVRDSGIGAFYAGFDAAVAAALAAQGWSLARLARRPGVAAQGRRQALPLLWEFGIPAAVAVVPTALFKVNWKGLFLYGPDMSCALAGIGGLSALRDFPGLSKPDNRSAAARQPARYPQRPGAGEPPTLSGEPGRYRTPAPRSTVTLCHCYCPFSVDLAND
jgi:hypothetical protein